MADFGINWGNIQTPNVLGSYLQGQQVRQQQQQNVLAQQRQVSADARLDRQDARDTEEFGLKKAKYARETATEQTAAQLKATQQASAALRKNLQTTGDPAQSWAAIEPALSLTGMDPQHAGPLKEAFLKNPQGFLDTVDATTEKKLQAVNLGDGGVGLFDPTAGSFNVIREPTYEQKYTAVPAGGALVPIPRSGGGMPAPVAGPPAAGAPAAGGDWRATVAQAAPNATVTSGYRSPEHNAAVGGVPTSRHMTGEAVDLVPQKGETMGQLYARLNGQPGIKAINEGDHVHVQRTTGGAAPAQGGGQYPSGTILGPPKAEDAPSGYQWANGRLAPIPGGPADPAVKADSATGHKEFAQLRKEFNQLDEVKNFKDVRSSYLQVRALASKPNPTPADDTALTFSFMKMLDPGSVVREGEFALVGKSAGLGDQVVMALHRVDQGKGLTPEIRKRLVGAAADVLLQRRSVYDQQASTYRGIAQDLGADPNQLVEDPTAWKRRQAQAGGKKPAQAGPSAPKPGAVVKGYRFKGGDPSNPSSWAKL